MNIIILYGRFNENKSISLYLPTLKLTSIIAVAALALVFIIYASYQIGQNSSPQYKQFNQLWQATISEQRNKIDEIKSKTNNEVTALSQQLGGIQANVIRINALGQKLVKLTHLDREEFNFSQTPPQGGIENNTNIWSEKHPTSEKIENLLKLLDMQLNEKSKQLITIEKVLLQDKQNAEIKLTGRPVKKSWISSFYGKRIDPFTKQSAWHQGLDIAGKNGSNIIATGSGVITWSGHKHNYGKMVEVSHGNGLVSRYAHNQQNLVKVGQIIKKGETIALMGSSGRSTGPHVHYEVWKNGKPINPLPYVNKG